MAISHSSLIDKSLTLNSSVMHDTKVPVNNNTNKIPIFLTFPLIIAHSIEAKIQISFTVQQLTIRLKNISFAH